MSIAETQWTGANVIIISPDSDNLSVLQVTAICLGSLGSLAAAVQTRVLLHCCIIFLVTVKNVMLQYVLLRSVIVMLAG